MSDKHRHAAATCAGLLVLIALIWLTVQTPPPLNRLAPGTLLFFMTVFTLIFSIPAGEGNVSLTPMISLAAYLMLGRVPAAWIAFLSAGVYGVVRARWGRQLEMPTSRDLWTALGVSTANATMHTVSILLGSLVYETLDVTPPLLALDENTLLPLIALGVAYVATNYLLAGCFIAMRGAAATRRYLASLPGVLLYEWGPLIFSPLTALVYNQLGLLPFLVFSLAVVLTSLVTRGLARASRRLERRVQELGSLHAVGQALSASLDLDVVLSVIHTQVSNLMPANNFYVALHDAESDLVAFPLAIEDGQRARWRSRQAANGLTEHVLRSRAPLLIPEDTPAAVDALGIEQMGRPAACWLGVPIMAGEQALGVIAVQSYSTPRAYDDSHREMLVTLAAHAAAAIQNARLYAQTDEALDRRVQELDSVLRTTREGILLLDREWRVLSANRALAEFLGPAQDEMVGRRIDVATNGGAPLVTLLGYTADRLRADCARLVDGQYSSIKHEIVAPGPPERPAERTIIPVRNPHSEITGWLLVLRDLSEEHEITRMRQDLTHMLIHDLRSPLSAIQGSLEMIEILLEEEAGANIDRPLLIAQHSSHRLLRMINNLLDISRLESDEMVLYREKIEVADLVEDVAARSKILATMANITMEVEVDPDLPALYVDGEIVSRVLSNLVDNAIKFTPNYGRVRLWAKRAPDRDEEQVVIGVTDNGPGIAPDALAELFVKFRLAGPRAGRRHGTGLGLPFCKLAVEAHGGAIRIETDVGRGATFSVNLPAAR